MANHLFDHELESQDAQHVQNKIDEVERNKNSDQLASAVIAALEAAASVALKRKFSAYEVDRFNMLKNKISHQNESTVARKAYDQYHSSLGNLVKKADSYTGNHGNQLVSDVKAEISAIWKTISGR